MNLATHSVLSAPQSAALRSFEAQWLSRSADSLHEVREQAMQRFLRLGLPTTRDDSWHHTNLRHLAAASFLDAPNLLGELAKREPLNDGLLSASTTTPGALVKLSWLACDGVATVLMVNGYPVLPKPNDASFDGICFNSLRELARVNPTSLMGFLQPLADSERQRWSLLNTALFVDGLHLKIDARRTQPLLIVHVATGAGEASCAYSRVIIETAPNTAATIIEHHVSLSDSPLLSNSATHLHLGANAEIEHYRVFSTHASATHVDTLDIHQDRDSRCKQFSIALGGGLVRTNLEAHLNAAGASLDSYSLLVGHAARHVDCVNVASHNAPHTRSRQTARAIASGESRVIFNSKVVVKAGALHSDSQQSCRGLLLSAKAEIDTRPQLEIHADEVKCAHGASIGRLDPDMLFYMLSRGLDRDTAQSLLVFAFLADVLTGMSVPAARSAIETDLIAQLPDSQVLRKFR